MRRVRCILCLSGCMSLLGALAAEARVDHVVAIAKPARYDGRCPASIEFIGTIFVDGPTRVSYRWERSDRATGPVRTIMIRNAGQGVNVRWELSRPKGEVFTGSETLHGLSPGDQFSNDANFRLVCR